MGFAHTTMRRCPLSIAEIPVDHKGVFGARAVSARDAEALHLLLLGRAVWRPP